MFPVSADMDFERYLLSPYEKSNIEDSAWYIERFMSMLNAPKELSLSRSIYKCNSDQFPTGPWVEAASTLSMLVNKAFKDLRILECVGFKYSDISHSVFKGQHIAEENVLKLQLLVDKIIKLASLLRTSLDTAETYEDIKKSLGDLKEASNDFFDELYKYIVIEEPKPKIESKAAPQIGHRYTEYAGPVDADGKPLGLRLGKF